MDLRKGDSIALINLCCGKGGVRAARRHMCVLHIWCQLPQHTQPMQGKQQTPAQHSAAALEVGGCQQQS